MRKCLDLTNLGVRVALYIEKDDNQNTICYQTHRGLEPAWGGPGPEPGSETLEQAVVAQFLECHPSSSIPDLDSLRLNLPKRTESPPVLLPMWEEDLARIDDRGRGSVKSVDPAHLYREGTGASRKRPRPASPVDSDETPRKRERSTSVWFDE